MARWLVVHPGPDWSVHDLYTGWTEALTGLGEQVVTLNLNERIRFYTNCLLETGEKDDGGRPEVRHALSRDEAINLAAQGILALAYQTWPDVILGISAFFTPPYLLDILRSRRHKVVLLHSEAPYQDREQISRAAHADLNLINDPATLDAYRAVAPAEYMPHAFRPQVHHPGPGVPELKSDFCFAGTYWPSRIEFFEQMDLDGLDVLLAGPRGRIPDESPLRRHLGSGVAVDNDQAADMYRSSKAGINFYRREGDEGQAPGVACGPREIEQAACGLFFLRDPRPESDGLFPMLPAFGSAAEASDLLRWYLAHDPQREKAAAGAREAVQDRTFDNHARRLLRLLEQL